MSSSNDSFAQIIFANFNSPLAIECFIIKPGVLIFTTFNITNVILLLPLSFFILCIGFQQWWQSNQSAFSMSHSDFFTYHLAIMELLGVFGCILSLCATYSHQNNMLLTGLLALSFTSLGVQLFHTLISVERYLAVVHPIIYMRLKQKRGIRNISAGCVWILCIVGTGLIMNEDMFIFLNVAILILTLSTVCHCTTSVLCVLIHPGPGKQGKGKMRVDQVKQRAFYTILTIQGPLALRFAWALALAFIAATTKNINCVLMTIDVWINLPSSLVLPFQFLYRAGKIAFPKT